MHTNSERAHLPNRMWEKIRLPSNYQKALAMIDERLMYENYNVLLMKPNNALTEFFPAGTGRSSSSTRLNNDLPV